MINGFPPPSLVSVNAYAGGVSDCVGWGVSECVYWGGSVNAYIEGVSECVCLGVSVTACIGGAVSSPAHGSRMAGVSQEGSVFTLVQGRWHAGRLTLHPHVFRETFSHI